MRRTDREITNKEEILAIIREADVCRIAVNDGDFPYIVPLNFGVDEEPLQFYFHGALAGKKIDLLKQNPKVTFEMDVKHQLYMDDIKRTCTMKYESVMGHGIVDFLPEEEKLPALKKIMAHYHKEEFPFNEAVAKVTAVFRLTVTDLTAKRR